MAVLFGAPAESAGAAVLFSQPAYQSPVRADPDDLLLLPGYGFSERDVVVYQAIADTSRDLVPPAEVPKRSTPALGTAEVVSRANIPDSLTVRLPEFLEKGRSYALWVVDGKNRWSNGIRINDARPLWITPSRVYRTAALGSLPRHLKVVGRNLRAAPGQITQVRLSSLAGDDPEITLQAFDDGNADTAVEQYVAKVDLPDSLEAGEYAVQVSRDGQSWIALDAQKLTVLPDPSPGKVFPVRDFGCLPDDAQDDTPCIRDAIRAAARDGGTVAFGPGAWSLADASSAATAGILVVPGVSLRGAGAEATTLIRSAGWGGEKSTAPRPSFVLLGQNRVEGLTFKDERVYGSKDWGSSVLQLGRIWYAAPANEPRVVRDVTISRNVFDKPFRAIVSGGLPVERLVVSHNVFGAFNTALDIDGDANNVDGKFHLDDSIVAFNTFKPGSYMDVAIRQGTIASQIGASRRLDFSNNVADGASSEYLYRPQLGAKGWRAAFFWHLRNNQEMLLVSENQASCTGDKTGDGEAFAFDNNHNSFGFDRAQTVLSATPDSVTVKGPLQIRQEGKAVSPGYYDEHWVQVAEGPGVGQVRRVASYTAEGGRVRIAVAPPWDVIPEATSRLALGREFWQFYVVDNEVDHRKPPCLKSNRQDKPTTPYGGGLIGLWAQAADSAIEGNRQYDTTGITLHPAYSAVDPKCPACTSWTFLQYFLEIRGNTIEQEYDWDSDCSWSGIMTSYGASPSPGSPPPAISYGVAIARNAVVKADGYAGGAISFAPTWWDGPAPNRWPLLNGTVVYHNTIDGMTGTAPSKACASVQTGRTGIHVHAPTTANTVFFENVCAHGAAKGVWDKGAGTALLMPSERDCRAN